MFIGREKELETLNKLYNSKKFEFSVIYGRRRVGKTALLNEFVKDKPAIFITGVESTTSQNLENLSTAILEFNSKIHSNFSFNTFQSALEYVFELAKTKRIILVIDEYPYIARSEKSLASTLQLVIDKYKETSKLFLILCGSSMSYMEDNVLSYKAPLYGRRTSQLKIDAFNFFETSQYLKKFSSLDKALAYGIMGGTPQYLLQLDNSLTMEENIKNTFLNSSSPLFEEPINLLKQEVREPALYNAIICAIASGCTKLNEIANKIHEETSLCSTYIKNLISLGLVKKENPYGENSSKKTLYFLEDNMFKFWYCFVPQNISLISRGASDLAYSRIEPNLTTYMGPIFEEICKQYLWRLLLSKKSPVNFTSLGRWWGTNPKTHSQEEIDIMAQDQNSCLFGECKWTNDKVDLQVLQKLIERSNIHNYQEKYFYLFSKSGFTSECIKEAKSLQNVFLISYSKILEL